MASQNMSSKVDVALQARVLVESLPYLRKFHGETIVIKYGGHAMIDDNLKQSFARSIALLKMVGINPIVVHGGGPQIANLLKKLEIPSNFCAGLRVTDAATMEIVEMVLGGSVNKDVVNRINQAGARAVGISGKDAHLLKAKKRLFTRKNEEGREESIDLGFVGDIFHVETSLLYSMMEADFVPVIAPIAVGDDGETYNINADDAASAVAGAMRAKRFLLLTDVAGVLDKEKNFLREIDRSLANRLIEDGTIDGGMIPKVRCCLEALDQGVGRVTIVDGRVEDCILLELLTDKGVGTQITC